MWALEPVRFMILSLLCAAFIANGLDVTAPSVIKNKDAVCGFCAGEHETNKCELKDNDYCPTCANCKLEGKEHSYEAWSVNCPTLKEKQTILKRRIPFYQRVELEKETS